MFNPYGMYTCGKFIPVFDNPDVGKPVFAPFKETEIPNLPYLNSYNGTIMDSRPTFDTPTHDPTGKHPYFHTSKIIWSNDTNQYVISCHQQGYNGSQNNVYRDSTGRRQRY